MAKKCLGCRSRSEHSEGKFVFCNLPRRIFSWVRIKGILVWCGVEAVFFCHAFLGGNVLGGCFLCFLVFVSRLAVKDEIAQTSCFWVVFVLQASFVMNARHQPF